MKLYTLLLLINLNIIIAGSISGKIVDQNDNPLFGANVLIKNYELGATSNNEGMFFINNILPGKHTLIVSYIGFKDSYTEFYISESNINNQTSSEYNQKLELEISEQEDKYILKAEHIEDVVVKLSPLLLDYNEIVVSATKTKEKVYDAPATISLVSQRKIREFAGNDIGSAVSKVKGMDVYQAGNGRTNINTRGFMAVFNGRFVTLMDGKKFTDPIFRTAFNNTFPTIMEDIDRLEIVFGPSSALYGPNAHNGLINIITKHPKDYPGMNFSITSGDNFQSQRLRYAASGKKISYKVNFENSRSSEWNFEDKIYAPGDTDNNGVYSTIGEEFEDINGNGIIDSESYYDADHNGYYSVDNSIERQCFLEGCSIDLESGIPTSILDSNDISYDMGNVILFEGGDMNSNGKFDYLEPFIDCGYNSSGERLCEGDDGWTSNIGDGMHTGPEGVPLFNTDFERNLHTIKALGAIYYDLGNNTEFSIEPTFISQKNYVPYDLGYLFIENLYSSISSKYTSKNFNFSLNYDNVDGEIITSEELYNAALKLYNGNLENSIDYLTGDNNNKDYSTNALYGNFSGKNDFKSNRIKSLIYGFDFRYDKPKTNRNILRDKGSNQKFLFDASPHEEEIIGEDISILQSGGYAQLSTSLSEKLNLVMAARLDFHSHFYDLNKNLYFSPRFALNYSGLRSSNMRLTYNRAHQTPSLFHLFGNIYNQNTINLKEDLYGNIACYYSPEDYDIYGDVINQKTRIDQPYTALFAGNGNGFTLVQGNDTTVIDPLEVEIVDSYEFGLKGMPFNNLFLDFNAYYSKFHNMTSTTQFLQTLNPYGNVPFDAQQMTHIGDQPTDKRDITFSYVNLGEIEYFGIDLSLQYQINNHSTIFSTYSYYNTVELRNNQNENTYVSNDWAWSELLTNSKDVSPYDIMHFNAPKEKITFGYSNNQFLIKNLYFELSGKYNSKFDFESGGWVYSEDDQNQSYLYSGCG